MRGDELIPRINGTVMMKSVFFLVFAAFTSCTAPQNQTTVPYYDRVKDVNVAANKVERVKAKQREATLKKEIAKTHEELEAAKKEIEELTEELLKAEEELKAAEVKKDIINKGSNTGFGGVQTGPRGGKYTISPSGKKVYQKR